MARLKIVHGYNWLDPSNGGPPYVIAALAACQLADGHDVSLISSDKPGAEIVEEFLLRYLPHLPQRTVVRPKFILPVRTLPALVRALRGADVAHLHGLWPTTSMIAGQVCRMLKVPYVISPHGGAHRGSLQEKALKKKLGRRLGWGRFLARADALHALNAGEVREIGWAAQPERVAVIPNGVFPADFERRPEPGAFRSRIGAPYVLFLSRLHHGKGCDLLGEAFAQVAAARPDVHLVMCGPDQGGRAIIESAAARFGYADRLHVFGRIDGAEKHAAVCDAAVYCLPSRHEGFSMAITEAMAWGRPVVITLTCNFPEAGEAGAAIETGLEPASIAEGLLTVLNDPSRGEEMGRRGRELVLSRYTWPEISRQMVELYETLR